MRPGLSLVCRSSDRPCQQASRALGTKTGCLHKMLSIINRVYQAIKRLQTGPERNTEKGAAKNDNGSALCTFDLEASRTFLCWLAAACPKYCYSSGGNSELLIHAQQRCINVPECHVTNKETRERGNKKTGFTSILTWRKLCFIEGDVLHLWGVAAWLDGGSLKDFQGPAPEHRLMAVRGIRRGCKVFNQVSGLLV